MNTKVRVILVLLAVLAVAGVFACLFYSPDRQRAEIGKTQTAPAGAKPEIRNVVLISIDTCRADRLGCYGYSRRTSPNIDAVAAEGILFEHAVTPVPVTLPAHSSMLTGTIPPYHKVRDNNNYRLAGSNITLAEILRGNGFVTGAVIGAFILDSQFGLNQGFDTYDDQIHLRKGKPISEIIERKADEVTSLANAWLDKNRNGKFFLFIHYFDPHTPYELHKRFGLLRTAKNFYDSEIEYTDRYIGQVIKKLKDLNLYDSTLLIIAGDHGEGLGEHKEKTHGYLVYHSTLHVPLIIKVPGGPAGEKIKNIVGLIDILPTVCSSLGIPVPPQVQGQDLNPYFKNEGFTATERSFYCESLLPTKLNFGPFFGLVSDRWKYIHSAKPELYNFGNGICETENLIDQNQQQAHLMHEQLKVMLKTDASANVTDYKAVIDEKTRKRLESLGYIAGRTVDENVALEYKGKDPRELAEVFNSVETLFVLMDSNKFNKAKKLGNKMLTKWPDLIQVYFFLGRIALAERDIKAMVDNYSRFLTYTDADPKTKFGYESATAHTNVGVVLFKDGKIDQAVEHYKKALAYNPYSVEANHNLANAYLHRNNLADAVKYYNRALELKPDFPEAHCSLASVYLKQGRLKDAILHFNKALELKPDFLEAHFYLGNILLKQGKFDDAIKHYNEVLRLKPGYSIAQGNLNIAKKQKQDIEKTIAGWTSALQNDPNQPQLHNNLGIVFQRQGDIAKAVYHWQKALELKPDLPDALNNLAWVKAVCENKEFYDPDGAVKLAGQACELTSFKQPAFLDTLSIAYAAAGKFPQAVETAQKALELAVKEKQRELAFYIQGHLELYQKRQPYREQ